MHPKQKKEQKRQSNEAVTKKDCLTLRRKKSWELVLSQRGKQWQAWGRRFLNMAVEEHEEDEESKKDCQQKQPVKLRYSNLSW